MEDEGDSDVFMFICDNDLDNIAITKGFISETGEEVAFSISQSRSAGKKVGQDTIAALSRGRYECCVICDGHDLHGEIVSRAVCKTLSQLVIENLLVSCFIIFFDWLVVSFLLHAMFSHITTYIINYIHPCIFNRTCQHLLISRALKQKVQY